MQTPQVSTQLKKTPRKNIISQKISGEVLDKEVDFDIELAKIIEKTPKVSIAEIRRKNNLDSVYQLPSGEIVLSRANGQMEVLLRDKADRTLSAHERQDFINKFTAKS